MRSSDLRLPNCLRRQPIGHTRPQTSHSKFEKWPSARNLRILAQVPGVRPDHSCHKGRAEGAAEKRFPAVILSKDSRKRLSALRREATPHPPSPLGHPPPPRGGGRGGGATRAPQTII